MDKGRLSHAITVISFVIFIVLGLACASTPEQSVDQSRKQQKLYSAEDYYVRAGTHVKNGNYVLAIEDLTSAIQLDPNHPALYNNRSWVYSHFLKTNFDLALADANQAVRLAPNNSTCLDTRGWAYLGNGDYEKAIVDFEMALKIDSDTQSSIDGLTKARQEQLKAQQILAEERQKQEKASYFTGDGGKELSLAVLEPTGKGLAVQDQWMLPLIQGSLTGDFNRYSAMTIVDRMNLEKILAEQSQSMSGNYSDDDYIRIGRLTNAKLILTGSISKTANTLMMELSVTETETGVRKASYPPKAVSPSSVEDLSAVKKAAADLLEQLGITLTNRSLQSLKNPVAITVVQGQASLAPVQTVQQTVQNQQQDTQTRLPDAQTQLAEVQAQIALAKGITAQKQGTVVEALSYFIQATNYNPTLTEAASRMNTLNANISSGNIGVDTRNEIAWRRQWVARLQEAEIYFDNSVKTPLPYELVYSTDIQKGKINWQNETIELNFSMTFAPIDEAEALWKNPISGVINAVKNGLQATGRAEVWELSYWPKIRAGGTRIIGIDYNIPHITDNNITVVAEIINDKGRSIGRQMAYISYGYEESGLIITKFNRWQGIVSFPSVKADDITDTLSVRISSIDGIPAETASKQRNITILPLTDYHKRFADIATAKISAGILRVGDRGPTGGFIFYDKGRVSDGWRYLEAAPFVTEFTAEWGSVDGSGTVTEVGSGRRNTQIIIGRLSTLGVNGKAAQLCVSLNFGGKTDWFLPSKDELDLMYKNLEKNGVGGFSGGAYWSSSEGINNSAWYQTFSSGVQTGSYTLNKMMTHSARAVRAF
jgi:tetratricopeptide (TPR) repeat protein